MHVHLHTLRVRPLVVVPRQAEFAELNTDRLREPLLLVYAALQ